MSRPGLAAKVAWPGLRDAFPLRRRVSPPNDGGAGGWTSSAMRTCDDLQKDINSTMNALIEKMDQRAKCLAPSPTSPGEVLYPFDDPTESGSRSDEGASPSGDGCSDIQSEIDALWEKLEGLMNDLESDNCVNVKPDPGEWQGPAMYA